MRVVVLCAVCALFPLSGALNATPLSVPGFHGLRIPSGGVSRGAQPGGGGRIVLYTYHRNISKLDKQMRTQLKTDGWKIIRDRRSPRGTIRLTTMRKGSTVWISVTRDGLNSALVLSR